MEPLSADDPRTVGEFRLHARLGAGGMGQVYLGFSPAGRPVAIKTIHTQFARDQEFRQRVSREVAAARNRPQANKIIEGVLEYVHRLMVGGPWQPPEGRRRDRLTG